MSDNHSPGVRVLFKDFVQSQSQLQPWLVCETRHLGERENGNRGGLVLLGESCCVARVDAVLLRRLLVLPVLWKQLVTGIGSLFPVLVLTVLWKPLVTGIGSLFPVPVLTVLWHWWNWRRFCSTCSKSVSGLKNFGNAVKTFGGRAVTSGLATFDDFSTWRRPKMRR